MYNMVRYIQYTENENHDSLLEKWPKSSLEQVNLQHKLNGKWDQHKCIKSRVPGTFLGLQDTGRRTEHTGWSLRLGLVLTGFRPCSSSRVTPAHASQVVALDHGMLSYTEVNAVKTLTLSRPGILSEPTPS